MGDGGTTRSLELVTRAQQGDEVALGRLFSRYYDRVERIVRIRLWKEPRLRKVYDPADFVHEAFFIAVKKFRKFEVRHEASLINWLAKIAINCLRTKEVLRDNRVESLDRLPSVIRSREVVFESHSSDPLPLQAAVKAEEAEILNECLQELKEEYQEVILLRHYAKPPGTRGEVPWEVVAEEIGAPSPNAARMLHSRALLELSESVRRRTSGGGKR